VAYVDKKIAIYVKSVGVSRRMHYTSKSISNLDNAPGDERKNVTETEQLNTNNQILFFFNFISKSKIYELTSKVRNKMGYM